MSPLRLQADAPLQQRNTFGVAATAAWLAEVDDAAALPRILRDPRLRYAMPLGGGSNLLFAGDPPGAVLVLGASDIQLIAEEPDGARVRADAGANWHQLVLWTLERGLCGLENLALIPGTVGAAPIQNIGAYGVEVSERVHVVEAFDRRAGHFVRMSNAHCGFGYRDSLFKRDPERFIVTAVEFSLARDAAPRTGYAGIAQELEARGIERPQARDVAAAVIAIRRRKLPDPDVIGNAGSFFKNPVVPAHKAEALQAVHPGLPVFTGGDAGSRKLSAAWLIDACGWKGRREGDAGVSAAHALVLVNHGDASGAQLLDLARRVAASVEARFGVAIEPEPRIVGALW